MSKKTGIVKEGLLRKQGGRIQTWHERWFVLSGFSLSYFKTRESDLPIKRLPVVDISNCEVETTEMEKKPTFQHYYFKVTTAQRVYTMSARSPEEREEWVKAIRSVVFKEETKEDKEPEPEPEPTPKPKFVPVPFTRRERAPFAGQPIDHRFNMPEYVSTVKSLCRATDWSDVVFTVGTNTFYAHRAIVACRCPKLARLFPEEFDNEQQSVTVRNLAADHFSLLLDFIYTGSVELAAESAVHVLHAAKRFELRRLEQLCQVYIRDSIEVGNVITTLVAANKLEEEEIQRFCLGYISDVQIYQQVITLPAATAIAADNKDLFVTMSQVLAQPKETFAHSLAAVEPGPNALHDDLLSLLQSLAHCDVRIVCKDRDLYAHKCILAVRLPNFLSEGAQGVTEPPKPFTVLKFLDIKAEVTHLLLEYIYSNRINVAHLTDAYGLIELADKVQQDNIISVCNEMMRSNLTEDSALKVLMVATRYSLRSLKKSTLALIVGKASVVCQREALNIVLGESPHNVVDIVRALVRGEDGDFSDDGDDAGRVGDTEDESDEEEDEEEAAEAAAAAGAEEEEEEEESDEDD